MKVLFEPEVLSIHVSNLQDGELAMITDWTLPQFKGEVVQRFDNKLVRLGRGTDAGWSELPLITPERFPNCKVRVLKTGTKLVI